MSLRFKIEIEDKDEPLETMATLEMEENQEIVLSVRDKKITIKILTE